MSELKKQYFKDIKQGMGKRKPQERGSVPISFFSFQHQIFHMCLRIINPLFSHNILILLYLFCQKHFTVYKNNNTD